MAIDPAERSKPRIDAPGLVRAHVRKYGSMGTESLVRELGQDGVGPDQAQQLIEDEVHREKIRDGIYSDLILGGMLSGIGLAIFVITLLASGGGYVLITVGALPVGAFYLGRVVWRALPLLRP